MQAVPHACCPQPHFLSFAPQEGAGLPLPCSCRKSPRSCSCSLFPLTFMAAAENKCKRKAETLRILLIACFHFYLNKSSKPSGDGFTFSSAKQTPPGAGCQLSEGRPLRFQETAGCRWPRQGHLGLTARGLRAMWPRRMSCMLHTHKRVDTYVHTMATHGREGSVLYHVASKHDTGRGLGKKAALAGPGREQGSRADLA